MKSKLKVLIILTLFASGLKAQSPIPSDTSLFYSYSTTTWNKDAIQRIADVGKLWGTIKYFHPEMLKGNIDPDELILNNVDELLKEPSKQNFIITIDKMLNMLHDPNSKIMQNPDLSAKPGLPPLLNAKPLSKEIRLIQAPQNLFSKAYNIDSCFTPSVLKSNKFIVDLRNANQNNDLGLKQYQNLVQPLIAGIIDHTLVLPTHRTAYYHAMLRQDFPDDLDVIPASDRNGDPNYWYQERFGLKNTSQGAYLLANNKQQFKGKRFCFIVNQYADANTLKALLALKNRNQCYLIFDGAMPDYLLGDYYTMQLSDGISLKIR